METFRLPNFWNVGPNVNFGQISKNTHKRSNKIFATKPNGQISERSNFHNKNAKSFPVLK